MGLFDRFKTSKVQTEPGVVYAPLNGKVIPLAEIPDPVFSQGLVGQGCGMEPADGDLAAPFNGKVVSIPETRHAVGLVSDDGIELLIHVGMDTVQMNGDGFQLKVKEGDKVSCGQLLMKFDMDKIRKAGYPVTTAIVVTNSDRYSQIAFTPAESVTRTAPIGSCK